MKKLLQLIYILLLLNNFNFGHTDLWINDPQRWAIGQGTFEEAAIAIQPKGVYFEYNLFLTISAKGLGLSHQDTVEIIYNFELLQNAIVHDSWLWFGDDIIKGKILDKWTASQIYEEIVNRRKDPSVLYKNYDNNYELRVFPMAGDESRKVKLTFLVPAAWSPTTVSTSMPLYLFNPSANPLNELTVLTQLTSECKKPRLEELPNKVFEEKSNPLVGDFLMLTLNQEEIYSANSLNYQVDAPFDNGVYLNTFEGKEDNIYQLAYLTSIPLNAQKSKKAAILIDYEISKSSVTAEDVIKGVKKMLLEHFTERDSFNLIFSNTTIKRISENWISADSVSITNIFDNLPSNIISNYSNLPSLLANGIEFISENDNNGQIVLIANSDQVGENEAANALIDDLMEMMVETIPISIGDYIEKNYRWYYYGNRDYKGNSYFYDNITKLTGGNVFYVDYNNPFNLMLNNLFGSLGSLLTRYDLHTTLQNGFCYGRFDLNLNENSISVNTPILQLGKYVGDLPFKIEFNGMYEDEPFSNSKEINEDKIFTADSTSDVIWAGEFINTLEDNEYNLINQEIYELIDISIDKRVLTKYTAFICLEPGVNIDIYSDPTDSNDDGWLVDVAENEKVDSDTLFSSYPNPFNNQTTIKIRLSKIITPESATFKIYDVLGQVVKTFIPTNNSSGTNEFEFHWNGENENNSSVSSGNYFFVMTYAGRVQTLKLVLVK